MESISKSEYSMSLTVVGRQVGRKVYNQDISSRRSKTKMEEDDVKRVNVKE
jgi:hypothetical protein